MPKLFTSIFVLCSLMLSTGASCAALTFSGYEWNVSAEEGLAEPGPNLWDARNVWLDQRGWLHLKITRLGDGWHCAEVYLSQNLGFGRYQWEVAGSVDRYDPQIVLGLFNYTRPDVGPDGTNEIDIELARWGNATKPPGNFSVWPAVKTVERATHPFDFKLSDASVTLRFDWSSKGVKFEMLSSDDTVIARWDYIPSQPEQCIPQQPLPLHMNLWLCDGKPPQNNQEADVIIKKFTFTPEESSRGK